MKPIDNKEEFTKILKRYENGEATPQEILLVEKWYELFNEKSGFTEKLSLSDQSNIENRMENVLHQRLENAREIPKKSLLTKILSTRTIAASVLLCILIGFSVYLNQPDIKQEPQETFIPQDLNPGGNKAILTLTDGSSISLENMNLGMVARQGNTVIHKPEEGLITYSHKGDPNLNQYNTIVSPAGGEYRVQLSDGSRIWLNSESSITFPAVFTENERMVKITGEVYFDIVKDVNRPFYVEVDNVQKIKVLGTQFNVNAYKDEGIVTTTLIEGSVEIIQQQDKNTGIKLTPGEQSSITGEGEIYIRNDVNTEEILAWKNGTFQFENTDIHTVMRQIGRWYNVEIIFAEEKYQRKFSGKINRNMNASQVFEILKFTGLNFKIESLPSGTDKGKVIVLR